MELSEDLNKKIIAYCEQHPAEFFYDQNDNLSNEQLKKILESEEGLNNLENEMLENNLDYIFDMENEILKDAYLQFKDELQKEFVNEFLPDFNEEKRREVIIDYLQEDYREFICADVNIKELFRRVPKQFVLIKIFSNYDCCNSFDSIEDEGYLNQVFKRVRTGVKKEDYLYEFHNGAYGGSLFCFGFKTSLENLIQLKKLIKEHKRILIPKGTQFGFFSDMNGAGSPFDKVTYRNMYLNIQESGQDFCEYDCINIVADVEQHYTMDQVYCPTREFLNEQKIIFKN